MKEAYTPWRTIWIVAGLSLGWGGCGGVSPDSGPPTPEAPDAPETLPRSNTRLTAEQIQKYPNMTFEELLVLHFPGLQLRGRNEPGGSQSVQILGMGRPLFVIDGVPLEYTGGAVPLNPRDIEYVELLKYGGATALYGVRGANGVIVVVTKR